MRMWRSGNASPCRGEVPGPIPGIRSRNRRSVMRADGMSPMGSVSSGPPFPYALVAECRRAGLRNLWPGRVVRVQVPPGVRHGSVTEKLGTSLQSWRRRCESARSLDGE